MSEYILENNTIINEYLQFRINYRPLHILLGPLNTAMDRTPVKLACLSIQLVEIDFKQTWRHHTFAEVH